MPMANEVTVHNPHDKGYKRDLSVPAEFLHFLQKYVGEEWTKDLTAAQLRLCDKEFVDKDYEGREADLIYEITGLGGEKVYFFVLQELQSTVDYTMIFRVLVYVYNNLHRFFLSTPREVREAKDFKLPAMVPIVFYNGAENWTAAQSLQEYQQEGERFSGYLLNLKYYLIDLARIEEEYILSTNAVIDNIMYCDKFREKESLIEALKTAYDRVKELDAQSRKEFDNWVKHILFSLCGNKEAVMEAVFRYSGDGGRDMAFQYNIVRIFEKEREDGKSEGKFEIIAETVRRMLLKGLAEKEMAQLLGQTEETIGKIMSLIKAYPEAGDGEIAKLLLEKSGGNEGI